MGFSFLDLANSIVIKKKMMGGFLSSVIGSTKQGLLSGSSDEESDIYKYKEENSEEGDKEKFQLGRIIKIIFELEK